MRVWSKQFASRTGLSARRLLLAVHDTSGTRKGLRSLPRFFITCLCDDMKGNCFDEYVIVCSENKVFRNKVLCPLSPKESGRDLGTESPEFSLRKAERRFGQSLVRFS